MKKLKPILVIAGALFGAVVLVLAIVRSYGDAKDGSPSFGQSFMNQFKFLFSTKSGS
jgi:hypothetical protein